MNDEELELTARGFSLAEIWDGFIEQIALYEEHSRNIDDLNIDQRLQLQERIVKLEKLAAKTEAAAWKETKPKKRFELYTKFQEYKKELERLKHGES